MRMTARQKVDSPQHGGQRMSTGCPGCVINSLASVVRAGSWMDFSKTPTAVQMENLKYLILHKYSTATVESPTP
jgi:hypothetical protein